MNTINIVLLTTGAIACFALIWATIKKKINWLSIGMWLWAGFIFVISYLILVVDRLIIAFVATKTAYSMKEVDEFPHYRDEVTNRVAIYAVVAILFGIYKLVLWLL